MCSFFMHAQPPVSLLIVDTQGKDAYYYRNLIHLAHSVGFRVDYKNIYDFLEDSEINNYQALFFMLSPAMLSMNLFQRLCTALYCFLPLQRTHNIPEHCYSVLRTFAQQSSKAIALILPSGIKYDTKRRQALHRTLNSFGQFQQLGTDTASCITQVVDYLIDHDTYSGTICGTSLILPSTTTSSTTFSTPSALTHCTPLTTNHYSSRIQHALPIGLLIQQPQQNNTYLISTSAAFTFADIAEHLFKNPFDIAERNELLQAAHETLQAFHDTYVQHTLPSHVQTPPLPSYCKLTALQNAHRHAREQKNEINTKLYGWMLYHPIACAWLDPYDFFAHEDSEHALKKIIMQHYPSLKESEIQPLIERLALERGIKMLYDGNFQLLWFEFIPEWYLSPHGMRSAQKEEYINRIKKIAHALQDFFTAHHAPLPKIFIGLNLTSNFKLHKVTNPVQSMSGTLYTKIPSPFDITHFWQPEVIDMFAAFITTFKDVLPIDGVFFDFEMYHAPEQAGGYTDLMDFSDTAWHIYCNSTKNSTAVSLRTPPQRLFYLQQNKKFKEYFTILQQTSRTIGQFIKQRLRHLMPDLLFAAYAPTLPSSWFYRGIMAGLSSPTEPLILATFNTDYQNHRAWLQHHSVYLLHGTAIMMSKLHSSDDINFIKTALTHHDFIWYNRPSRMIYHYSPEQLNKVWWGIEATAAPCKKIMNIIRTAHGAH